MLLIIFLCFNSLFQWQHVVHSLKDEGAGGLHPSLNKEKYIWQLCRHHWAICMGERSDFSLEKGRHETSCKTKQGLALTWRELAGIEDTFVWNMILIVKPSIASGGRRGGLYVIHEMCLWNMIGIIKLSWDLRRAGCRRNGKQDAI